MKESKIGPGSRSSKYLLLSTPPGSRMLSTGDRVTVGKAGRRRLTARVIDVGLLSEPEKMGDVRVGRPAVSLRLEQERDSKRGNLSTPKLPDGKRDSVREFSLGSHDDRVLTPSFVAHVVLPLFQGIAEIQRVFDEVLGHSPKSICMRSLTQNSPVKIGLEGAGDAIKAVEDVLVPWRRKHEKTMKGLAEAEKAAEIAGKVAEATERKARAKKDGAESRRFKAEAAKLREEARALRIANDAAELEFQKKKVQVALEMLDRISPNLPDSVRLKAITRLLPATDRISQAFDEVTWEGRPERKGDQ